MSKDDSGNSLNVLREYYEAKRKAILELDKARMHLIDPDRIKESNIPKASLTA